MALNASLVDTCLTSAFGATSRRLTATLGDSAAVALTISVTEAVQLLYATPLSVQAQEVARRAACASSAGVVCHVAEVSATPASSSIRRLLHPAADDGRTVEPEEEERLEGGATSRDVPRTSGVALPTNIHSLRVALPTSSMVRTTRRALQTSGNVLEVSRTYDYVPAQISAAGLTTDLPASVASGLLAVGNASLLSSSWTSWGFSAHLPAPMTAGVDWTGFSQAIIAIVAQEVGLPAGASRGDRT